MMTHRVGEITVLIIDDDFLQLSVLIDYFNKQGIRLLTSKSGAEGVALAIEHAPDMILLDILMPEMDGFEICQKLKALPKTQDIPVIFMTALSASEDIVRGFEVGAIDYISKPFSKEEVMARMMTHLSLLRQRRELAEANAMKDTFFATISREMRNALVPLIGLSSLLDDKHIQEQRIHKVAHTLREYVDHVHNLLENLLYWANLQMNKVPFRRDVFDVQHVVLEVKNQLRQFARSKEVLFEDDIAEKTMAYADQEMCRIVLKNLLTNAIMFTPRGGAVRLTVTHHETQLVVGISDTGIGISPGNLQRLFQVNKKFSTTGTNGEHGSGFGLIISKILVEKLGGAISVESEVGQGTTVRFTLPLAM